MGGTRLLLTCGLPGAGKTALARRLARDRGALRLTKDDWLWSLGSSPWDGAMQERVERELRRLATDVLRLDRSVVLDFGLWTRGERDELRCEARELGLGVELHVVEAPEDELWRRLEVRNSTPPWNRAPIGRAHLDHWIRTFERPGPEELALFDPPPALDEP